jgi:hypothetical protein
VAKLTVRARLVFVLFLTIPAMPVYAGTPEIVFVSALGEAAASAHYRKIVMPRSQTLTDDRASR